MTKLLQQAIDRVQTLPDDDQDRVARLMLEAANAAPEAHEDEQVPFWKRAVELMKDVPNEELDRLPTDGATEHDHYIYGTPKKHS